MSFSFGAPKTQSGFTPGTSAPAAGGTQSFSFGATGAGDANKVASSGFSLTPSSQAQAKPVGSGFGTTGFGATPVPGGGFNLGGAPAAAAPATRLGFGTQPTATTAPASTGLSFATPQNPGLNFSGLATSATGTGFGIGNAPTTAATGTAFGLGGTSAAPATGLSFETPKPALSGFASGGTAAGSGPATGSSFGASNVTAPNTGFSLGGTPGSTPSTGFNLGGTPATGSTAAGVTLGAAPASSTPSVFNLGGAQPPATSAPASGFGLAGAPASVPATAATSFNLGGSPAVTTGFSIGGTAATSATTGFNLGAATTPIATSGFTLDKITAPQSQPVSTATATSASIAPLATLGAVTTVSASTVSGSQTGNINFCQLEESINKWTLELEEQEKAFVNQATQVNAWDRLLIANGEKIVTLNQEVERVILEQQQLEHELDYVVGQQRELQDCLVPLEKELSSLSMSDPEREYTYRLAENLDTQLKQMSEDLKEIIEHLNEANRSQDSGDPIVQIGKILNAHMNSLQWLDQRTALLAQKIQQIDHMHQNFRQENERSFNLAYN